MLFSVAKNWDFKKNSRKHDNDNLNPTKGRAYEWVLWILAQILLM